MENCSFQTELVSIMEILAKAAVAEINRRVDDSCAVLRLEITQSQNDIFVLKKKCEVMEAELKRSRIRAKKKGFSTSVHEVRSPLSKDVLDKEPNTVSWGRESTIEQIQALQHRELESANEMDVLPIKEEGTEGDAWNNGHQGQSLDASAVTEICPPLVKDISNKEVHMDSWGGESTLEQIQALQRGALGSGNKMDVLPIKEEGAEDDTWINGQQGQSTRADPLISEDFPEHFQSSPPRLPSPSDPPDAFARLPAPQPGRARMKQEEPDKVGACAITSGSTFLQEEEEDEEEEERQQWAPTSDDDATAAGSCDPGFMYGASQPQYEPSPSLFKSGLLPAIRYLSVDLGPPVHSAGKLHLTNRLAAAARARRRPRNLGFKRLLHQAQAQGQAHCSGSGLQPAQMQMQQQQEAQQQHQYTAAAADIGDVGQATSAPEDHPGFYSNSRGNVALAKARMRALSWRSGGVGDKRFCCTYCDKSFVRFCQLEEHLRRHTGERPFHCLQCGRGFTKQCNLIRHAVVHSGEKPHQCAACGKCFTQRSSLKSHQKSAH